MQRDNNKSFNLRKESSNRESSYRESTVVILFPSNKRTNYVYVCFIKDFTSGMEDSFEVTGIKVLQEGNFRSFRKKISKTGDLLYKKGNFAIKFPITVFVTFSPLCIAAVVYNDNDWVTSYIFSFFLIAP